jgi:hypothetical protein
MFVVFPVISLNFKDNMNKNKQNRILKISGKDHEH